jgi:formylglycine-generating enzyme required for sulfatase activity
MKQPTLLAISVLGGWIVCGPAALPQEKTDGGAKATPTPGQPSVLQSMAVELKLTAEQETKADLILREQSAKSLAILRDAARAREQNRQRRLELQAELRKLGEDGSEILAARTNMKALQEEERGKLKAILTSPQWEQWTHRHERAPDLITNSIGMKLKLIQPGSFMMGKKNDNASGYMQPVHKVTLTKPFYLGVYEVTQREYRELMGKNPYKFKGDNYPVEWQSWYAAQEFCAQLWAREGVEYRLPTEAEWEYSCRAGTTTEFYWGDKYEPGYCWTHDITGKKPGTTEVGQMKPNAWGLFDMLGNVSEWCEDSFVHPYPAGDQVDPRVVTGDYPVVRGGMWWDDLLYCNCNTRTGRPPDEGRGFRLVRAVR